MSGSRVELKHRRPPSALDGVKDSSAERRVDHFSCSSRPMRSNIEPSCVSTVYLVCNLSNFDDKSKEPIPDKRGCFSLIKVKHG
ncbi:hypothetical protein SFRURICE_000711 [Spodoptera frugiperda]|nr:hypothetical protein SFRURICE_000711 [Spodoptera frugiperda]